MRIVDCEQGSEEWVKARIGRVTASRIADVVARTRSGYGASRANYMAELIAERLTGTPTTKIITQPMQWGKDQEPHARALYEFMHDVTIKQVGLVIHPDIEMAAASPDGLIGDDGLIEIKCPNTATHIDTLLGAEIDGSYVKQMQWQMACTGSKWCDFVSYDPRMPPEMQVFVYRMLRHEPTITELESEVMAFLQELGSRISRLTMKYRSQDAAE